MIRLVVLLALCAIATIAEDVPVTCGSVIKLKHAATGFDLHSHEISYGSGSGQQSVTGFQDTSDANSLWVVTGAQEAECVQGTPIKSGTAVRLQHVATRRWLHSHHFPSPLSQNLEVSAFGNDKESDHLDNWEVQFSGSQWLQDQKVKLKHKETGGFLSSSADKRYGRPIGGQLEICGKKKAGRTEEWMATEGIFFPERSDVE
ncbi:hypothetical protein COCSUDRAFT_27403 [Coccomyxa subellipsoidea C-169]|uniref:MIR domain-containing protein n=1 Tax=Coccomyxa subellipsoidea (strain C-169) TaxID=574566 RepID=I0Z521_COCSC|nr:hypothetical protein COCSUDRAFT_27403 [Coccomyxa subellipsoidea C-169]EIE25740.1 hypothetical protein COCSUDRAFT_27403 [Coccomyxa subellipsoidea C-169]|eukprot:XP_005650284.1 hypothetical protein COCSUDRAFT_27403 [Coccomyxa subellipsoidea C-169]